MWGNVGLGVGYSIRMIRQRLEENWLSSFSMYSNAYQPPL
jgi:hypothetical protein